MASLLKLAAVAGLLVGLGSMAPPPRHRQQCTQPSVSPDGLMVMTYNVKGLPWPVASNREAAVREIAARLAALCGSGHRPNIVVMQEAFGKAGQILASDSGYRYALRGPSRSAGESTGTDEHSARFVAGASVLL